MMWTSVADDNETVDCSDELRQQCTDDSYYIILYGQDVNNNVDDNNSYADYILLHFIDFFQL